MYISPLTISARNTAGSYIVNRVSLEKLPACKFKKCWKITPSVD